MIKLPLAFALTFTCFVFPSMAGPVRVNTSSNDDLRPSETFGYGYYHPRLHHAPLVASGIPLATPAIAAPLTTHTGLGPASAPYGHLGYAYGNDYKYASGNGFGRRWGYGSAGDVNEFYRHHPVYVAWG